MSYVHQTWHDRWEDGKVYGPNYPKVGDTWEVFDGGWAIYQISHVDGPDVKAICLDNRDGNFAHLHGSINISEPKCISLWMFISGEVDGPKDERMFCCCGQRAAWEDYLCKSCRVANQCEQ